MEIEPEKAVLVLLMTFLIVGIATAQLLSSIKIPNQGQVKTINLQAFQDAQCTIPLTEINWGSLEPNQTASFIAYLLNDGNSNTTLTMQIQNWNPPNAINDLTLTWDSEGKILKPNKPLQVTFTLKVSENPAITNFSFDIIIVGSEYA